MEPTSTPEAAATEQTGESTNGAGSAERVEVHNPATNELITTLDALSPDGVAEVVARAREAQPAWQALGFEGRSRLLLRMQKWTMDNADRIARTIVAENGKAYEDALVAEVGYTGLAFGFWAKHASKYLADEKIRSSSPFVAGRKLVVRYEPIGVVGVIGPWNYPLTNSFGDCIPALAAGNSVVLKPATLTPMTSLLMLEGFRECGLPEGVFNVAVGQGSKIGDALIDAADYIMFTGSTEVGRKVMERAGTTLTGTSMELGGKDPMIVLRDADLERAANAAVHYSMQNTGQTCISVERVYVEEPIYDEFTAKVTEKMRGLRHGVPGEPGSVDVGSMTSEEQTDIVEAHVNDAVTKGARAVVGGNRGSQEGNFFEPTLLFDVDHSMDCMTEETFGPTLPVMRVSGADEAVELANDSPYGLQASIWTKDTTGAERLARRLESGVVCVNDSQINYGALELPMGGWKDSGVGSRHGTAGIRKYTKQQTLLVTKFAPMKKDIHMMPYGSRVTGLLRRGFQLLWGRGKRD